MTPALASSSSKDVILIRPTEAQLRYSQFHHKRKAQAVKQWILELYQTPAEVLAEENSVDSDDYNSSDTNTPEVRKVRQRRRPPISAGRRALLKKSRKKYRQRRKTILNKGYRGFVTEEDKIENGGNAEAEDSAFLRKQKSEDGQEIIETIATSQDLENQDLENIEEMDAYSNLEDIFMTAPKRRPQQIATKQQDIESYKRFRAACHAMMMNIKTSYVTTPVVAAPTKRWKRSEQHIKAAEELQHGDYLDYKWGVRKRNKADTSSRTTGLLLSAYYHQNHQIMDRGASWMMHLPKHVQYNRDTPYFHNAADLPPGSTVSGGTGSDFTSSTLAMRTPGPKKFNKLVAFVQQRLIEKEREAAEAQQRALAKQGDGDAPKMRLKETHVKLGEEHKERRMSRAKEIAESMEANTHPDERNNRIQQIARSLEGGDQTPTMKVKAGLDFGSSGRKAPGSQQRRARYIPRMRLRDFNPTASIDDDDDEMGREDVHEDLKTESTRRQLVKTFEAQPGSTAGKGNVSAPTSTPSPTMNLRTFATNQCAIDERRMSKAEELALAMEEGQGRWKSPGGKIKDITRSLEPDKTPKMKLRNDIGYEHEEKKVSEERVVPSKLDIQSLTKEFEQSADASRSSFASPSIAESDFFAQVRSQSGATKDDESLPVPPKQPDELDHSLSKEGQKKQDQDLEQRIGSATAYPVQELQTPSRNSDAASDVSRESNLSGLWNRGRNSIASLTKSLNTIAETQADKLPPEIKERASNSISKLTSSISTIAESHAEKLPPEIKERASNVTGRVSDFFSQLRNQGTDDTEESESKSLEQTPQSKVAQDDQPRREDYSKKQPSLPHSLLPSQSEDSHEALAAYRKKRETLSSDADTTSEASSYHALPDQIRQVVQNSKASPALVASGKERFVTPPSTQNQSSASYSTHSELSSGKMRLVHESVVQNSFLAALDQDSVIDRDDVDSDVGGSRLDPQKLASLMMSPEVLQKRLKQAIRAVENRNWEQVLYLINANPWLAEMKELTTNQFLLHKLAFFGGGSCPAPADLCERLIEKFPAAVYKFDQDGNVPLHLAAAAGNLPMIEILGEKFESGASIRNEDGMLPLHFTIASLADFVSTGNSLHPEQLHATTLKIVKTVLRFFPKAVSIADNVGNIPIHVAAECLDGGIGIDVLYLLMDEAERQLNDPFGARFRNKVKLEEVVHEDMSTVTMSTDKETESSVHDGELHCSMVLNNQDETPLLAAIRSRKSWEMIEALLSAPDGDKAALFQGVDKNNVLHMLVGEYQDSTAAMSVLKMVPEAASVRNSSGMLPIELACTQFLPEEVILSIALVDIPFNIDDQNGIQVHEGRGGSWYFLTCESDDHLVEIVQEIVSICSFQQLRELCFMTDVTTGNVVIERATPKCRAILSQALRFLGRFEFVGNGPIINDPSIGFKAFDALDFGGGENIEGTRVLLECYDDEERFEQRVSVDV